jgi:hypothetical protein
VGFVPVANCPTNGATPVPMALPGSLLLIDRFGKLSDTLGLSGFIEGPWDYTVQDRGYFVKVFISNVLTGTIEDFVLRIVNQAGGPHFKRDLIRFMDVARSHQRLPQHGFSARPLDRRR